MPLEAAPVGPASERATAGYIQPLSHGPVTQFARVCYPGCLSGPYISANTPTSPDHRR